MPQSVCNLHPFMVVHSQFGFETCKESQRACGADLVDQQ